MAFCSRCGISIEGRFCSVCGYDNQPQEKTQGVEETVNQLYSLRAGISLVASETGKIEDKDANRKKEIANQEKQISERNKSYKQKETSIREKKQTIETHKIKEAI